MKTLTSLASVVSLTILGCFAAGCSANSEDVAADTANVEAGTLVYQHDAPKVLAPVGGSESSRLLLKLFAAGYRSSTSECDDTKLTEARIVPEVSGKITGSFTGNGRNETLYVISVWDCDASHADGFGTTRFVVTEGTNQNVVANAEFPGAHASLNRILDLDRDGQNGIVLTTGYSGQGVTLENASLVRFAGSNLAKDEAFEAFSMKISEGSDSESPFFVDTCNTGMNDGTISFAKIFATLTEGKLAFTQQRGTAVCPAQ